MIGLLAIAAIIFIVWFIGFGMGYSNEKKTTKKILEKLKSEIDPCLFAKIISEVHLEDKYE